MKNRINILFLLLAFALLSCEKEDAELRMDNPIQFSIVDEFEAIVETKATEVTTANLTSIYVTATRGTVGSSETATFTSTNFTGTSGGTFSGGKYWPSTDPSYHFYGSNISQTFSANSCTVNASSATDVVCAYLESPTYLAKNMLTFKHIFARIGTVTINPATGYSISGVTVKITPNTGGTYNIRTGNGQTDGTGWSSLTAGSETTLTSSNNNLYLVPGNYILSVTYTLSKGDWSKEYNKEAMVSLSAGSTNNISATTPDGAAKEIVLSVSLTAWGTQNFTPTFE